MPYWELIGFFFIVALLYGSVGFGGGSSYLAILALYGFEMTDIRSTALLCNIAVVSGSVVLYYRSGLLNFRRVLPIIVVSIPLAFIGGMIPIREATFFILLASALLFAALLMWMQPQLRDSRSTRSLPASVNAGVGGGIGLVSGMVGIGGGIFLSPLLHLIKWAEPKAIAATAAIFILVNSIAGLAGQTFHPDFRIDWAFALPLLIGVVAGGQIGSRLGISYFSQVAVKRATALLVLYVSVRIFIKYLT
jgi:uncharacterized membrane protein YfcA